MYREHKWTSQRRCVFVLLHPKVQSEVDRVSLKKKTTTENKNVSRFVSTADKGHE